MPAPASIAGHLASADWPRLRARLRRVGLVERIAPPNVTVERWVDDPIAIADVVDALDTSAANRAHVNLLAHPVVFDFADEGLWLVRIGFDDDDALVLVNDGHVRVARAPFDRLFTSVS